MARSFTMSVNNGPAVAMEEAGWSLGAISLMNQGPDSTRLTRGRARRGQGLGLAWGDRVLIQMADTGRRVFYGTVTGLPVSYESGALMAEAVVSGPWWDFERRTFTRGPLGNSFFIGQIITLDGVDYEIAHTADPLSTPEKVSINHVMSAKGYLYDPTYGPLNYRTMDTQVEEIVDYMVDITNANQLFAKGDIDGTAMIPRYRVFADRSSADCLRDVLDCNPSATVWFDYTADPVPILHVSQPGTEETLTLGAPPLARLAVTPRPDLVPSGIIIRHQYAEPVNVYHRGFTYAWAIDRYPATAAMTDDGVITVSQDDTENAGAGGYNLAQTMYEAMATLRSTGTMDLYDPDLSLWVRPGLTYRVTGDAAVEHGQLLVQSATWNPKTGVWSAVLGYPRHNDLQHYRDMRGWLRRTYWAKGTLVVNALVPPPAS
jgi:hypothetical protein